MNERQSYETKEATGGECGKWSFQQHAWQEAKALSGGENPALGSTIPCGGETPPARANHVIEATAQGEEITDGTPEAYVGRKIHENI